MLFRSAGRTLRPRARAVVTLAEARAMPRHYNEMSSEVVLSLASLGDQEAREERLVREIMSVSGVEWAAAKQTFKQVAAFNKRSLFFPTLPYSIGIFTAVSAAFLSIPLVFELNTVLAFNEMFVTADVPEQKDLETPLEVGSWAWNWMEPPLGQISFFLLCMQFSRSQLQNIGAKPYTEWLLSRRAAKLVKKFPEYDSEILISYSKGVPLSK